MRFALCDDERLQRQTVRGLLDQYAARRPDLAIQITAFPSADALLTQVKAEGGFDVYLLDIIMPDKNGIDLGVALRKLDDRAIIIFLTSSPDFALDSYKARAFQYLVKPVSEDTLSAALDEALTWLARYREASVTVKTKGALRQLELRSILYAERVNRRVRFYLVDGACVDSLSLRESFREAVAPLLAYPQFTMCSVSYLVNLDQVGRVERDALWLKNGKRLPVSRAFRDEVTRRWVDYVLKDGGWHAG